MSTTAPGIRPAGIRGPSVASFPGDQAQRDNATVLIRTGHEVGANAKAIFCCIILGWGENDMRADGCNSSNHCGIFQLSGSLQSEHDYHDVHYWAGRAYNDGFWGRGGLKGLAAGHPSWSPGYIVNLCQGAYSNLAEGAAYYNRYQGKAHQTIAALGTGSGGGGGGGTVHIPSPTATAPPGQLLKAYNPSTIIRHDFYRLGKFGHHAAGHALAIRQLVARTKFCTTKGRAT
jgi:hypothetical protein